eukprot:29847-Eustigmatos_ZCMA.PRE.1
MSNLRQKRHVSVIQATIGAGPGPAGREAPRAQKGRAPPSIRYTLPVSAAFPQRRGRSHQ